MTSLTEPATSRRQDGRLGALMTGGVILGLIAAAAIASGTLSPRPPRFELIAAEPFAVQLHLGGALTAFAIGAVLLLGPKGNLPHRTLGWTWAGAMGLTAVSSLFITGLNPGSYSLIHLISGWVIIALPAALHAARRHKVPMHRRMMSGLYFGGMFVAGGFAFLPGRLLWSVFFG